jgi:2-alkenal reductase
VDPHRPQPSRPTAAAARVEAGPLRTFLTLIALGTTAVVLAVGLAGVWRFFVPPVPTFDPDAEPRVVAARGDLAADELATIELFERSVPSAVSIVTSSAGIFQGRTAQGRAFEMGTGSGFVWNADGIIVTNHHVIEGARTILVSLDEREAPFLATLIGSSEEHDIAALKIDVRKAYLRPVPIGTSSELRVGQKVFAIGAPFGLQRSLSTGVIGATERLIEDENGRGLAGLVQTDAAINPGNSGGPLLDSAGRLIGMNTAIASRTGTFSGIGFAVPVDTINWVVPHLLRTGTAPRPGIGVRLEDPAQVALMGLEGALVRYVHEGSAAARAGLRGHSLTASGEVLGDLIVGVNGERVASPDDLRALLVRYAVGESVTLDIVRSGRREQRVVELGSLENLER